jgi:hypothetical protein
MANTSHVIALHFLSTSISDAVVQRWKRHIWFPTCLCSVQKLCILYGSILVTNISRPCWRFSARPTVNQYEIQTFCERRPVPRMHDISSAGSHSVTSTLRSQAASRAKQIQYKTCPSELDLPHRLCVWQKKMNIRWAFYWHNASFHLFTAITKSVSTSPVFKNEVGTNFQPVSSTFYPHHLVL